MVHSEGTYAVGDYLLDRLAELGVDRVFGVPGDYSLGFLDHVVAHRTVEWTGCANELNAGYAADGYGRLRRMAALSTTFGVGELSAINAIAGSFAEFVPVVHIVGAPGTTAQAAQRMVHHSLGDGVFTHFLGMHAGITCARAALTAATATAEIDRVLTAVRDHHLPGYLLVPADVAEHPVDPPSEPLPERVTETDADVLAAFVDAARRLFDGATSPTDVAVLVGLLANRLDAGPQLFELIAAGPLPHATSLWAKSLVDESAPTFVGTYAGGLSDDVTRRVVESSSALVLAGVQFTDLNTGLFTHEITRQRTIEIGAVSASVGAASFAPLELRDAIAGLVPVVADLASRRSASSAMPASPAPPPRAAPPADTPLSQSALWDAVSGFLRSGDIVLADLGTSFFGMATSRLPHGVTFLGQPLWASIGYTLPALLGACLAEPERRGVLLIGDGAAQLTAQELATVLRHGLAPLVVVVDNDGYTIERAIHGPSQPYNDISRWDWTHAPAFFGDDGRADATRASTVGELRTALDRAQQSPDRLTLIQAVVPQMDVPSLLDALTRGLAAANAAKT